MIMKGEKKKQNHFSYKRLLHLQVLHLHSSKKHKNTNQDNGYHSNILLRTLHHPCNTKVSFLLLSHVPSQKTPHAVGLHRTHSHRCGAFCHSHLDNHLDLLQETLSTSCGQCGDASASASASSGGKGGFWSYLAHPDRVGLICCSR